MRTNVILINGEGEKRIIAYKHMLSALPGACCFVLQTKDDVFYIFIDALAITRRIFILGAGMIVDSFCKNSILLVVTARRGC